MKSRVRVTATGTTIVVPASSYVLFCVNNAQGLYQVVFTFIDFAKPDVARRRAQNGCEVDTDKIKESGEEVLWRFGCGKPPSLSLSLYCPHTPLNAKKKVHLVLRLDFASH